MSLLAGIRFWAPLWQRARVKRCSLPCKYIHTVYAHASRLLTVCLSLVEGALLLLLSNSLSFSVSVSHVLSLPLSLSLFFSYLPLPYPYPQSHPPPLPYPHLHLKSLPLPSSFPYSFSLSLLPPSILSFSSFSFTSLTPYLIHMPRQSPQRMYPYMYVLYCTY